MSGTGVLVVVETSDGVARETSFEAIGAGLGLAGAGYVTALVLGSKIDAAAGDVARTGVAKTLVVDAPELARYTSGAYARAIEQAIEAASPRVVLLAGTTAGRDLGPYVAARAGTSSLSDCIAIRSDGDDLVATRPVYQGKMLTEARMRAEGVGFVVVRAGVFEAPAAGEAGPIETLSVSFDADDLRVKVVGGADKPAGAVNLEAAETIIVGGRGVGSAENFAMIEELAAALGGPVGATRAVTDLGWRPHYEQIGQTGKTVKPKLYIGVGVSGAVQHTVGMQGAETIVVINRDPDAPLFRFATIGVVGDLNEVVPALTREIRATRGSQAG